MAVIAAATKTVSFKAPYTGRTFQVEAEKVLGRDGYIDGGETSDDTVVITIQPVTFVQRGIFATTLAATGAIAVPTAPEPWFLYAAIPDDDPDSGVQFAVTADRAVVGNAVVVAFKANGVWQRPSSIDIRTADANKAETGVEHGGGVKDVLSGTALSSVTAFAGDVVDPDGKRRRIPRDAAVSGRAASLTPLLPNALGSRTDHAVLRQREGFSPELMLVMGSISGFDPEGDPPLPIILQTGAGVKRAGYFARRGGTIGQQWWAWGNGTALRIQGGPAGEAFAATTLLTGAGTIVTTWIAGQRASDSAVLLLYVDGTSLRLVSFNAATGAQIDAPVTIDTQAGAITHVQAVLDRNEQLHVTFEHDEATQQIYYARYTVSVAAFGSAAVSPRIIAGAATGTNDTWPSIGIDRNGIITVAYIEGAGTDEFGELVVAKIDPDGENISLDTIAAASDVGVDPGVSGDGLGLGVGASALGFLNFRRTAVVITPHDETYVFTCGLQTGTDVRYLLVHNERFEEVHGHKLLNAVELKNVPVGSSLQALAATTGEQGEIFLAYSHIAAGNQVRIAHFTFSTPFLADGRVGGPQILKFRGIEDDVDASGFTELHVGRGPAGEVLVSYLFGTDGKTRQSIPLDKRPPPPHPKDLYLGGWIVPEAPGGSIVATDPAFDIFNTRPKRMNYPFLVGNEGDYQGFTGIHDAVERANQIGGEVIVRSGQYRVDQQIFLFGGVSIRGEGRAVLVLETFANAVIGVGGQIVAATTISGNVVSGTAVKLGTLRAGDLLDMATSGFHVVARNLGFDGTNYRVVVENNKTDSAPVGATATLYWGGTRIENLTFITQFDSPSVKIERCYQPTLRALRVIGGSTVPMLEVFGCIGALIDGIDLTDTDNTDTNFSARFTGGDGNIVRGVRLADGKGKLRIENDEKNLHLIGCSSDGTDSTKIIYDFEAGRATPVFMSSCEGRISAAPADLAFVITNVGKRLRLPEGGGALELEDDNTRASTITDDGIKLSSVTHKQFDGVSTDTITDAVNERIKAAGDTVLGALLWSPDSTHDLGTLAARPRQAYLRWLDVGGTNAVNPDGLDGAYGVSVFRSPQSDHDGILAPLIKVVGVGGGPDANTAGVMIDTFGGLKRLGQYMFEEFDTIALDANKWSTTGTGTTTFVGSSRVRLTPGSTAGNFRQIAHTNFSVQTAKRPRFRTRIQTNADDSGQDRCYFGWLGAYFIFDADPAESGIGNTNWWIVVGGTPGSGGGESFDTGIPFNANALLQNFEMALVASNQIRWRISDEAFFDAHGTSDGATGVITTTGVANPIVNPGSVFARMLNFVGGPSAQLSIEFIESFECLRSDTP